MSSGSQTLPESEILKIFEERFNPDEEYLGIDKEVNRTEPLVSVYIVTYQHAPFIRDCLDGVLMQKTSFPIEILIGEDESTDGTREICMEYAEKHPDKIRLFLRDRKTSQLYDDDGNIVCRFNGKWLRKCKRGNYLAFCEGDDYWTDPFKLHKQISLMKQHPECHLSFHPVELIWGRNTGRPQIYKKHSDHNRIYSTEDLIIGGGEFCPTVSLVINTETSQFDPWRFKMPVQDYFSQVVASFNGGALYINEVMAVYRKGVPGSWSEKHKSYLKMCEHSLKMINANRIFDKVTEFKYHRSFKTREAILFKKYSLFKIYDYDRTTIDDVKKLTNKYLHGKLRVKGYLYILMSFFYYKIKMKYLFKIKNSLKNDK